MSNKPKCPPQEELDSMKARWIIDTSTGTITNKATGKDVGYITGKGYVAITNPRISLLVHHIIWWAHYGKWPDCEIDHQDRNKTNNAISNLREVSHSVQMHNREMPKRDLPQGVHYCPRMKERKYKVSICINHKVERHYFRTVDEAAQKYRELKLGVGTNV